MPALVTILLALAVPPPAAAPAGDAQPVRLLSPLPDHGAVPPTVELPVVSAEEHQAFTRRQQELAREIRRIRHEHFGTTKAPAVRAAGIAQLSAMSDPAAFGPMIAELAGEDDDVRLAVLDHLAGQGDPGQAALGRVAIFDDRDTMRYEATRRMVTPASSPVLAVLDEGLRSNTHAIANQAGALAGALRAAETIPLLIFAQATADPVDDQGDLAWIAVATQIAFVAAIQPVVGDGAGAFQPIPGVVQEGAILRVVDAVAIFYRTEVHRALVAVTTDDWGHDTAGMGYDIRQWWAWYNDQYVPFKNEQAREAALADQVRRSRG